MSFMPLLFFFYPDVGTRKTGILEADESSSVIFSAASPSTIPPVYRVTSFLEKPDPASTPSRKACPCFYLLHSSALHLLCSYLRLFRILWLMLMLQGGLSSFLFQSMFVHVYLTLHHFLDCIASCCSVARMCSAIGFLDVLTLED